MCQALKGHVGVLTYLISSEQSFLAARVLEGISSVIFDQMAGLNWLPRAQARTARQCLRELKPQLRRNQTKLRKLQKAKGLPGANASVGTVKPNGLCGR
jgi:hypothetical protein